MIWRMSSISTGVAVHLMLCRSIFTLMRFRDSAIENVTGKYTLTLMCSPSKKVYSMWREHSTRILGHSNRISSFSFSWIDALMLS